MEQLTEVNGHSGACAVPEHVVSVAAICASRFWRLLAICWSGSSETFFECRLQVTKEHPMPTWHPRPRTSRGGWFGSRIYRGSGAATSTIPTWSSILGSIMASGHGGNSSSVAPGAAVGIHVGEGLPPVPRKLADKIWRWEFVDMAELLPEFLVSGEGRGEFE